MSEDFPKKKKLKITDHLKKLQEEDNKSEENIGESNISGNAARDDSPDGFIHDCSRCGYDHANDSSGERDCFRNISAKEGYGYGSTDDYYEDYCVHIPFTKYLKNFKPESKVGSVKSFLVLGELSENLMVFTLIIERGGESYFLPDDPEAEDDLFDFKLFEAFRGKLKVIQDRCLEKAKVALEKWQLNDNVHLVFKDVFTGDWKEVGSIGKLEKHEEVDLAALNKVYAELSPIYVALRDMIHGAYCNRHDKYSSIMEPHGEVDELNRIMNEFKLNDFWT